MFVYRLKTALTAVAREESSVKIVTLNIGPVLRSPARGPMLPQSGLVDVTVEEKTFSVFMQDLQARAERIT